MVEHNLSSFVSQTYFEQVLQKKSSHKTNDKYMTRTKRNLRCETTDAVHSQNPRAMETSYKEVFQTNVTRNASKRTRVGTVQKSTEVLDPQPEKIVCSIYENRNATETKVGICAINFNLGTLTFSEFIDSQIYIRVIHKLQIYNPTDIVLPATSTGLADSKLISVIKYNVPEATKITNIPYKLFDDKEGLRNLQKFQIVDGNVTELSNCNFVENSFGLCAVAGAFELMKNVENLNKRGLSYKFKNLRIKFEGPADSMLIDTLTIKNLELVENNLEKNKLSLLKFLDSTSTSMGRRLLRNSILQPLTDKESILQRIEAVREIVENDGMLESIIGNLKHSYDMDKLFSKLLYVDSSSIRADQKINYILLLKQTITLIQAVNEVLEPIEIQSSLLKEIKRVISSPEISLCQTKIDEVINEDCGWACININLQNQKIYAVKNGTNGLLEASRGIYETLLSQIEEEINEISEDLNVPVDHTLDSTRGFVIRISKDMWPDPDQLPRQLINKVVKGKWIECHTLKLMKYNARLKDIITEICLLSEKAVHKLLSEMTIYISNLFMVSEAISLLDLICSFSTNTLKYQYCYPDAGCNIQIEQARHPVLDSTLQNFVSNDIRNILGSSNLQIITGCNMSGKSVYLKQIALLSVMFQIGSPIPAKSAVMRIFKNLHTRVCNDSLELSSSNFMFEMKETSHCLDNLSEDTLLILDELGRNSSINDG
ncbi:MutS protein msh4 [Maudiozyma exigua]|uniref:MutS protein msh4 n=1 Tax=Maudiozyma exigua TaxID=34358 RepID=A0A9P7BAD8_MAUEX|nr:MutS protein msh4 [Kazachstania exigua]